MNKLTSGLVLCLSLALCMAQAFAQNATTSLRGVVKDPSGAVVSAATVTLLNAATGQSFSATSKDSGEYQLTQIPPGQVHHHCRGRRLRQPLAQGRAARQPARHHQLRAHRAGLERGRRRLRRRPDP